MTVDATYHWEIVCLFVGTTCLIATVYMLICLFLHVGRNFQSRSSGPVKQLPGTNFMALFTFYETVMMGIWLLAILLFVYQEKMPSLELCKRFAQSHQFLHTTGFTILTVYLWLRQHILLRNKLLRTYANKHLKRFSSFIFGVIVCFGLTACAAVFVSVDNNDFIWKNATCFYNFKTTLEPNDFVVYPAFFLGFVVQASLLFIFVYILRRHQLRMQSINQNTEAHQASGRKRQRLEHLLRVFLAANAVAAASDIVVLVLDSVLRNYLSLMISNALWDIDMFINLLCMLVCFTNWKKIVFPWRLKTSRFSISEQGRSGNTTQSS